MNQERRRLTLLALGAAAAVGVTRSGISAATPAIAPADPAGIAKKREDMKRFFPNVAFRTQDDKPVRFYDDVIKGRKVLINFMYTDCSSTCPRTTANLVRLQKELGDRAGRDVFFVSITLTPEHDSPDVLKKYALAQGCHDGWLFLTGAMADINRVRRRLGVYDNPDISQHVGILTYGNEPEGKWGATYALASPDTILYNVLNRIDGWKARPWPPRSAGSGGAR